MLMITGIKKEYNAEEQCLFKKDVRVKYTLSMKTDDKAKIL